MRFGRNCMDQTFTCRIRKLIPCKLILSGLTMPCFGEEAIGSAFSNASIQKRFCLLVTYSYGIYTSGY